jgi:hypothetical protein
MTVSSVKWPSVYYCELLMGEKTFLNQMYGNMSSEEACEELRKNVAAISISYDTLNFMRIEEDPKIEIFGLVGNIGGVLGIYSNFFST